MLKIIAYLKNHIPAVLIVLVLLFVQVYCDLALPQYTSDIVDVGIQQGGIKDAVPQYISGETLSWLELYMDDADIRKVEKAYKVDKSKDVNRAYKKAQAAQEKKAEKLAQKAATSKAKAAEIAGGTAGSVTENKSTAEGTAGSVTENKSTTGGEAGRSASAKQYATQKVGKAQAQAKAAALAQQPSGKAAAQAKAAALAQKAAASIAREKTKVYKYIDTDKETRKELNDIFTMPMVYVYMAEKSGKVDLNQIAIAVASGQISKKQLISETEKQVDKYAGTASKSSESSTASESSKSSTTSKSSKTGTAGESNTASESGKSNKSGTAGKSSKSGKSGGKSKSSVTDIGEYSEMLMEQAAIAFVGEEYDKLGVDKEKIQMDYLWHEGLIMIVLTAVMIIMAMGVGFIASRVGAQIGRDTRKNIFRKVISFSRSEMDRFSIASLITRSTNDIQQIQIVIVILLRVVMMAPIMGIGACIKVVGTKSGLGWITVCAVAAIFILVAVLLVVAIPKFRIMQTLIDRLNLVSKEIITGVPVIRAFSREEYEEKRFEKASENLRKTQVFTHRTMAFMMPAMMVIMNIVSVGIVWFGAKGVDLGNLQVGDMIAFITYTMQVVISFMMLTVAAIIVPRAGVAAERIEEVLNTEAVICDKHITERIEDPEGRVEFKDVCFKYQGAEEELLKNISFAAEPGQMTAIIGSTGSGKSTLVNLVPRFFDVTSGSVLIDGHDVRDLKQSELRELIGYVPQKGVLFSGDISSNIKFASESISDEQMLKAADIAQASEFIYGKEDGFSSFIAQGGSNVSGGQKQRLSIARAIAKEPKIYIFDDSFSALDYKTDAKLRQELQKNTSGATMIIVAQRIATIMHADKIVVLNEGRIAGMGTHQQLLKNCGIYREIAESQLSEEELTMDNETSKIAESQLSEKLAGGDDKISRSSDNETIVGDDEKMIGSECTCVSKELTDSDGASESKELTDSNGATMSEESADSDEASESEELAGGDFSDKKSGKEVL